MANLKTDEIAGYDYGTDHVPRSPVSLDELEQLKETAGLTQDDERYLKLAGQVLSDQAEDVVNAWRAKIGEQQHLAKWFYDPNGRPDERYKAAVKARFVQWVIDLCTRPYDRAWLDYQEEIGLRHTPEKKNATDGAQTPPVVPLRYLVAFTSIVIVTAKDFLAAKGHPAEEVARMHEAWTKAVMLSLALWTRSYTRDELW